MKIVSLLPSATEIVYALDLEDALVGVTFECDHPPAAADKPVISRTSLSLRDELSAGEIDGLVSEKMGAEEPLYVLDEERIRSIQPDLILAQDLCHVCAVPSGQVAAALDKLGCDATVVSLDPSSVEDIFTGIVEVGRVAGVPDRAVALVDGLRRRVAGVRSAAGGSEPVPALALEWSDPPFIGGHWVPEMLEIAGGRDVFDNAGQRSRRVGGADIAHAAPEVVVF
ncbi:MAG: ABC transporter substrate-binding protein, partial [Actinomycetota bacterium]